MCTNWRHVQILCPRPNARTNTNDRYIHLTLFTWRILYATAFANLARNITPPGSGDWAGGYARQCMNVTRDFSLCGLILLPPTRLFWLYAWRITANLPWKKKPAFELCWFSFCIVLLKLNARFTDPFAKRELASEIKIGTNYKSEHP